MKHAGLSLLALLALSCSAAAQTNVNWGLQTGSGVLGVYDTSHTFVPVGAVNSSSHVFTLNTIAALPAGSTINAAAIAGTAGTLTNGHCVSINSLGLFVDAGGACTTGGGGGTVAAGTPGQLAIYAAPNTVGSFALAGDCTFSYGSITCTKTNGVPLGALAVLNTVPAATPTVVGGVTSQSSYAAGVGLGSAANGNTVPTSATLAATASARSPVVRTGYYAVGDSPAVTYVASGSACSLYGGSGDGGSQIPTSDGKCWLAQFAGHAWASQFGVSSSATDNGPAINKWLALASASIELDHEPGLYNFTTPLVAPQCMGCVIKGSGRIATQWNYTGAGTTGSLFTLGNSVTASTGVYFSGFRMSSSTTMTAGISSGSGFLFYLLNDSTIENLTAGTPDIEASKKLANGITFAGFHSVHTKQLQAWGLTDGIQVYGMGPYGSDIWLDGVMSYFSGVNGIDIGGNTGGVYIDRSNIFANGTCNVSVNEALATAAGQFGAALSNKQLFLGNTVSLDGAVTYTNTQVCINSPNSSNAIIGIAGYIGGATTYGINIQNCPYCRVYVGPAMLLQNGTSIYVQDTSAFLTVGSDVSCTYNAKCMDAPSPLSWGNIWSDAHLDSNTVDYTANTTMGEQTFTFTPTAWAGSLTTASGTGKYLRINQHATLIKGLTVSITTNGTGVNGIYAALPVPNLVGSYMGCRENTGSAQYSAVGQTYSANPLMGIQRYDGAYPGGNGYTITCDGVIDNY